MEWIGYIGIGILVLLVLLVLVTNIQIVQQSRAYVVERLGAYSATWGVGLHFKIPFFERVVKKVSLKEQVADFDPQPVITKDNVAMQIDTVIYFQITDPKLYTYGVEHPMNAIENLTATTLRNIIGEMELDQSLTSRDVINAKMRSILDEATDPWGIKVNRVELKNILPPREIQNAMEKQMKAERERRESILQAEGQKQSQILVAEGEKQSTILRADAEKQAAILKAEAERQAAMLFGIEQDNINRMAEGSEERVQAQADLDQRRAAADQQFADARAELSDLGECTWYIQDRGNIASYSSVESDSSSIEAIATVFPFIFFIVAVLISLTTATRMVEEERTLIGLYKALGYSRGRILSKYVDYALWACLIGGVLGNIIGFVGLPLFLFTVFDDMYSLPQMLLSYDIVSSIVSVALFAVGVVGATIIACRHEMAETPASLMRPKAPRAGSRILLERIGFIWRRMGFLNKVAARNLFRYKKRAFMTIFGIAGCTALVICGMGIRDTSVALSPKQYGHITRYDLLAVANPDDFSQTCAALDERSAAKDSDVTVSSTLSIMTDNVTFTFGGKSETVQLIVVPDDRTNDLDDYVRLEDESKEPLSLRDGDVYLSKSSQLVLGIQPGDTAHVQDSSLNVAKVKVSDISLNYLGNTLYMTQGTYERAFGRSVRLNGIFALLKGSSADQIAFSKKLKSDGWLSISSTAEHWENFEANFTIINSVVVLVTFMAACLSFVVVFTLSNTNISERKRELATIKVLGFRRGEVHHYVNKETLILTAIGTALGVPLGGLLAESFTYILQMPSLYFDVEVEPLSYVLAVVLSFGFTIIVNLATNRTLNKIDMVGALKSAE